MDMAVEGTKPPPTPQLLSLYSYHASVGYGAQLEQERFRIRCYPNSPSLAIGYRLDMEMDKISP